MGAAQRKEHGSARALDVPARCLHMAAMPRHDPLPPAQRPPDYERAATAWADYRRMMKWMALAAFVTVLLSLLYLGKDGGPLPLHMVIATVAGVGLTVLVGTGLMGLVFLSNRSGHDEDAHRGVDENQASKEDPDDRRG
jgi:hypothetical protein